MTDLNKLTALDAARRIAAGKITSEALVADCLARIAARDPDVRAWQFLDPEAALRQARALDRAPSRGVLHGVPLGVKDVFETHDMPTEHGSPIYTGNRTSNDAATVAAARHAGMVILGKTVTTEFATHVPSRTRNPHNPEHTPGGSSAGSAASVADCMVPLAIGTQTVGSTIRPASFCGTVAYKPSFNLLSRAGCKVEGDSLDTVGIFARSVPDVAAYAGTQTNDRRLTALAPLSAAPRVGVCHTFQWDMAQPETVAAVERAERELAAAGATVTRVTLPPRYADLMEASTTVFMFEMRRAFADEFLRHPEKLDPTLRAMCERGGSVSGEDYAKAMAVGHECRAMLADAFGAHDVWVVPSARGEAPRGFASTGDPLFNRVWTFLWAPAVTVPVHTGPNGLPVGVQVVGRIGDDARTLACAHWVHERMTK